MYLSILLKSKLDARPSVPLYRSGLLKDDEVIFNLGNNMKTLIGLIVTMFALTSFAADAQPAKSPEPKVKAEANCVTKDKNGKCPPAPKSEKPHAKKVEKKADAPKAEVKK